MASKNFYGDNLKRLNAHLEMLKVTAQDVPSLTVKIAPGAFWLNGTNFVEFPGGSTRALIAPNISSTAKFVVIGINSNAQTILIDGEATSNPNLPSIPKTLIPLAAVFLPANSTAITNEMIYDIRPIFYLGGPSMNHSEILNRDIENSHPISSITNLQNSLDEKIDQLQLNGYLAQKADINGTTANVFVLNKDQVEIPISDTVIEVERGPLDNVGIRFNVATEHWEYNDDGTTWIAFANSYTPPSADLNMKGIVKLSLSPSDSSQPVAVGDNDPRLLTTIEKASLINHLTDTNAHGINNYYQKTEVDTLITNNKVDLTQITTDIEITDITKGVILTATKTSDGTAGKKYRLTIIEDETGEPSIQLTSLEV